MNLSPRASAYVPGYQGHTSGANGQVTRVVVHCTVSPCERGGARNNARYFQSASAGGLAHYCVDPGEVIACCDENVSCWHAPPNKGSIGVELCAYPADDWADGDHEAMLTLGAALVRDICDRHGLPLVWLSVPNLLAGDCGVASHVNVAQAWHKTDHTDPGSNFPIDHFMQLVAGDAQPTQGDNDLTPEEHTQLNNIRADVDSLHIKVDQVNQRLDTIIANQAKGK